MDETPRSSTVAIFESRRSTEMSRLAQKHGLSPISAPALEERPLEEQSDARAFAPVLLSGACDVLILLTGVGTRMLVDAMSLEYDRSVLVEALGRAVLVCRGPKPVAVLKELGLKPTITVPEPNTYRELLEALDASSHSLEGKRVYVQEYGIRNEVLLTALEGRGAAEVVPVPIYGYGLPSDTKPLEEAIQRIVRGDVDAALFTSQTQVFHLVEIAEHLGERDTLLRAFADRTLLASIGPITTEALGRFGLEVDFEPEHPKMGHLIAGLAEGFGQRLATKRAG